MAELFDMEELLIYLISGIKPREVRMYFGHFGDVYTAYDEDAVLCRNAAWGEVDKRFKRIIFRCEEESFETIKRTYSGIFDIFVLSSDKGYKEA